jgi:lysophospholipase L1-like esterase
MRNRRQVTKYGITSSILPYSSSEKCLEASVPKVRLAIISGCLLLFAGCRLLHAGGNIAFLGDSITEGWHYPMVNLGVHGNTTQQMLDRFDSLIPGHGYGTVVILGGTNDILLGVDPNVTISNLRELGERTIQQHAEPILCEIPPIFHGYDLAGKKDYIPAAVDLNTRIIQLASSHHWKVVDHYTPLAKHPGYLSDGVHMKRRGYLAMEGALLRQLPAS